MIVERRERLVGAPPERVFAEVERLGGDAGWPYSNVLWWIRGLVDRLLGGVGMRLGRRDPTISGSATRSTSGGSRRSVGRPCCACGRR